MTYEVFQWNQESIKEWDDFVVHHEHGSIHQINAWKDFQETIPGRGNVRGYGMRNKDGQIIATCLCIRMSTGFQDTYWYYSPRGPVVDPKFAPETTKYFFSHIQKDLQENTKAVFWRLDPYFTEENYKIFPEAAWSRATQNYQPTDTLVLDLSKDEETLLKEMKRKGRYNIKQATKNKVKVRALSGNQVKEKDLDIFWNLNTTTTERDGFSGHPKNYYENFLKHLPDNAVLFIAEQNKKPLAAAINTHCGQKAIYYFGASTSDPEDRKLMAPYLLQWEMIQHAKKQGCTSYDFLGIAPENEPNHAYAGISEFKWKFGGSRHTYAPGKEFVFRPWLYKFYKLAKRLRR